MEVVSRLEEKIFGFWPCKWKPIILQSTIPLTQTIPRKCSSCQNQVLDDVFPYTTKTEQDVYIVISSKDAVFRDARAVSINQSLST